MNTNKEDTQMADVKIVLAALWIAHFLLWTFGDMLSLLQQFSEPVDNNLLLLVAVRPSCRPWLSRSIRWGRDTKFGRSGGTNSFVRNSVSDIRTL